MHDELKTIAATLKRDVGILHSAMEGLLGAIAVTKTQYQNDDLQIIPSVSLALWGHYKFDGDWNMFADFTRQELEKCRGSKSQMWVMRGPESDSPVPEAKRHVHRMNIALRTVAKELHLRLPVEDVGDCGWYPNRHVGDLEVFIDALGDIFNPRADEA